MSRELLSTVEAYLQTEVAPHAALIDRNKEELQRVLLELGDRSWLGLKVPTLWGGLDLDEKSFYQWQMLLARYSGALAFLQTQHQSAALQIATSQNSELQAEYLPLMVRGKKLIGVGFSQLRRPGKPVTSANPVPGGYLLEGEVPWITGLGLFEEFIVGATLPQGDALYGLLPLVSTEQPQGGFLELSQPRELIAMQSTNTVQGRLKQWFLPSDRVVMIKPKGAIHQSDRRRVLHHGFFALGCAQAALDLFTNHPHWHYLSEKVNYCRENMFKLLDSADFEKKLELRASAINLAHDCAQAAVVISGGGANFLSHPAGRVYREALVFSVSGQTPAVREATLGCSKD
ncbi:acyl-CoA dehydrogenase family protein [Gloeocapsa sp. PCC 73106]|uniref:acyl-CoA dehydrogenase family protein n=1 Tax=Gloeocapsa sp. PCC 73106 TaxID=102232 RepID=UPI0002AC2A4E|nr:acyl-CoA dehydrogenase family protein [Gloeocapsa sp. PCC 73106]ELR96792.1 acyl-CoA dehydrogenase [Gloeocapsa sp. PCC 73106]